MLRNFFIRIKILNNGSEKLIFCSIDTHLINLLFDFLCCDFGGVNINRFFLDFWELLGINELSVEPLPCWNHFIIDIICSSSSNTATRELPHVFTPITEEEMPFSLFLEIIYLPIIDLPMRVFNLPIANHLIFIPFSRNYLPRWKNQRSFSIELISKAMPDILIPIQELEMPFDFNAILIHAPELSTLYLKVTPLW